MSVCVYCGRRLPLLHRVIGTTRFCSKQHLDLHQKEIESLAIEAVSRLRLGAESRPDRLRPELALGSRVDILAQRAEALRASQVIEPAVPPMSALCPPPAVIAMRTPDSSRFSSIVIDPLFSRKIRISTPPGSANLPELSSQPMTSLSHPHPVEMRLHSSTSDLKVRGIPPGHPCRVPAGILPTLVPASLLADDLQAIPDQPLPPAGSQAALPHLRLEARQSIRRLPAAESLFPQPFSALHTEEPAALPGARLLGGLTGAHGFHGLTAPIAQLPQAVPGCCPTRRAQLPSTPAVRPAAGMVQIPNPDPASPTGVLHQSSPLSVEPSQRECRTPVRLPVHWSRTAPLPVPVSPDTLIRLPDVKILRSSLNGFTSAAGLLHPDPAMPAQLPAALPAGASPRELQLVNSLAAIPVQIPNPGSASPTGVLSAELSQRECRTPVRLPIHWSRTAPPPVPVSPDTLIGLPDVEILRSSLTGSISAAGLLHPDPTMPAHVPAALPDGASPCDLPLVDILTSIPDQILTGQPGPALASAAPLALANSQQPPRTPARQFRFRLPGGVPPVAIASPFEPTSTRPVAAWRNRVALNDLVLAAGRVTLLCDGTNSLPANAQGADSASPAIPPHAGTRDQLTTSPAQPLNHQLRRSSASPEAVFVPRLTLLPLRPGYSFGPLPAARPDALSRASGGGTVIPFRSDDKAQAASAAVRTLARR